MSCRKVGRTSLMTSGFIARRSCRFSSCRRGPSGNLAHRKQMQCSCQSPWCSRRALCSQCTWTFLSTSLLLCCTSIFDLCVVLSSCCATVAVRQTRIAVARCSGEDARKLHCVPCVEHMTREFSDASVVSMCLCSAAAASGSRLVLCLCNERHCSKSHVRTAYWIQDIKIERRFRNRHRGRGLAVKEGDVAGGAGQGCEAVARCGAMQHLYVWCT